MSYHLEPSKTQPPMQGLQTRTVPGCPKAPLGGAAVRSPGVTGSPAVKMQ